MREAIETVVSRRPVGVGGVWVCVGVCGGWESCAPSGTVAALVVFGCLCLSLPPSRCFEFASLTKVCRTQTIYVHTSLSS
jgi:hypothetical protein